MAGNSVGDRVEVLWEDEMFDAEVIKLHVLKLLLPEKQVAVGGWWVGKRRKRRTCAQWMIALRISAQQ